MSRVIATHGSSCCSPYGAEDPALTKGDADPNAVLNPYGFQGKRPDVISGTLDMGARRFGPDLARFLQADRYPDGRADLGVALDPLTRNRYAFAEGTRAHSSRPTDTLHERWRQQLHARPGIHLPRRRARQRHRDAAGFADRTHTHTAAGARATIDAAGRCSADRLRGAAQQCRTAGRDRGGPLRRV